MNYLAIMDDIFRQFQGPRIGIKLWNSKIRYYGQGSDTTFILHLDNALTVKKILTAGALGFGESYMDGSLKIEGDIEEYLKLRHQFKHVKPSVRLILAKFIASLSMPRTRPGQVAQHYDLGNDFFHFFLDDKTMSYSAGHYLATNEDLAAAQLNKLKLICDWLRLPPASSILDLGSGWGGFASYAALHHGWQIHGYTLSQKQLSYSQKLINQQKSSHKVSFAYGDFTQPLPPTVYDGIVMIEALEHVGQKNLGRFLKQTANHLKPSAPFYLQFTGRYQPKLVDPWTLKYVFPGGHLPAKTEFLAAVHSAGLIVEKFADHTPDYQQTMSTWIQSLEDHQADIEKMFSASFFRLWQLWTHGAHVSFDLGAMNLFRVLLRKPSLVRQ